MARKEHHGHTSAAPPHPAHEVRRAAHCAHAVEEREGGWVTMEEREGGGVAMEEMEGQGMTPLVRLGQMEEGYGVEENPNTSIYMSPRGVVMGAGHL